MPVLLSVPVLLAVVTLGVVLYFLKQSRFLSSYLVGVAIFAKLFSFLLSAALFLIISRIDDGSLVKWAFIAAYVVSVPIGGILGAIVGFFAALKANQGLRIS